MYEAWLIEFKHQENGVPSYLSGLTSDFNEQRTTDAWDALHFGRKQDAETIIRALGWTDVAATATEHMFL